MPANEVTTVFLRFRDLVTEPGGTIETHAQIIDKEKHVWWGWWSKAGERIPDEAFRLLKAKAKGGPLEVYLFDSGRNQVHRAKLADIHWNVDHERAASPDGAKTPRYYSDQKYLAWFNFVEITRAADDPSMLQKFTCVQINEFFTDQPSRYTPFYNKRIYSPDELRQQDRTIWFVRPVKPGDTTHFVSLLDADRIAPAHFPRHLIESKSSHIALTSDVHFSVDDNHGFPTVSTHDKLTLGARIENCLTEFGIDGLAAFVVAGDLTWKSAKEEYDLAEAFLKRVNSWAKLRNYQFVVCPGNHDLAFTDDPAKIAVPITKVPADARKAYEGFYENLFYQKPNEFLSSGRHFLLGGGVAVDIVALNSNLLEQHKGAFQGHGFIGDAQLEHAAKEMGWKANPPESVPRAYRVVAVHHHVLPVTFREEAKHGSLYSVVLDAEAFSRWLVNHRVDLVIHGHMHQPFVAEVNRPVNTSVPGDEWHSFHVLGLGSAGVKDKHLGEVKKNSFAILDFSVRGAVQVKVFTISPTTPSQAIWGLALATPMAR